VGATGPKQGGLGGAPEGGESGGRQPPGEGGNDNKICLCVSRPTARYDQVSGSFVKGKSLRDQRGVSQINPRSSPRAADPPGSSETVVFLTLLAWVSSDRWFALFWQRHAWWPCWYGRRGAPEAAGWQMAPSGKCIPRVWHCLVAWQTRGLLACLVSGSSLVSHHFSTGAIGGLGLWAGAGGIRSGSALPADECNSTDTRAADFVGKISGRIDGIEKGGGSRVRPRRV
jgi:hypothetical protein